MSEVEIKNEFIIDTPLPLNIINDNNKNIISDDMTNKQIVDIELGHQNQPPQQARQSFISRIFKYLFFENFTAKKIFRY
jgi:hypothetical protein